MSPQGGKAENPNAFKLWINRALLEKIAVELGSVHPAFDRKKFVAISRELDALELKPRVQRVRDRLRELLPSEYSRAVKILVQAAKNGKLEGFDLWPFTEFVQTYGLEHPDLSLDALYELTQRFTAEFAVRPFFKTHPEKTHAYLLKCATDPNTHVRRWVSEGSRPRLPWGERLNAFIENPRKTLPLLEKLKHDSELYVRKSVANHLNDIAKDHPRVVIEVLGRWKKAARTSDLEKIDWITKHALRSLIKAGNRDALSLLGVSGDVKIGLLGFRLEKSRLHEGEKLGFRFDVVSRSKKPQKLVVDYVIHYMKSNGKTAPKVFKLRTFTLGAGEKARIEKAHSLKRVTTRKHYPGRHKIEIQINGRVYAGCAWVLL